MDKPSLISYIKSVFFVLGIIFLFATLSYFAYKYVFNLSDKMKTLVLVCLIIIFFFVGDFMVERGV